MVRPVDASLPPASFVQFRNRRLFACAGQNRPCGDRTDMPPPIGRETFTAGRGARDKIAAGHDKDKPWFPQSTAHGWSQPNMP